MSEEKNKRNGTNLEVLGDSGGSGHQDKFSEKARRLTSQDLDGRKSYGQEKTNEKRELLTAEGVKRKEESGEKCRQNWTAPEDLRLNEKESWKDETCAQACRKIMLESWTSSPFGWCCFLHSPCGVAFPRLHLLGGVAFFFLGGAAVRPFVHLLKCNENICTFERKPWR